MEFERLLQILRPESVMDKEDLQQMKDKVFGPQTFFVTETRLTDDFAVDAGWLVRLSYCRLNHIAAQHCTCSLLLNTTESCISLHLMLMRFLNLYCHSPDTREPKGEKGGGAGVGGSGGAEALWCAPVHICFLNSNWHYGGVVQSHEGTSALAGKWNRTVEQSSGKSRVAE